MKAKLVCKKCETEVGFIQIHFCDVSFSKEVTVVNGHNSDPFLVEFDREYQSSEVDEIIYVCKCGETVITKMEDSNIEDFGRIDGNLNLSDLKNKKYGEKLFVIVFDESLAGTVSKVC